MDRLSIYFSANQQSLVCESEVVRLVEGTVNYVDAIFTLGDNWTGFDSVRAIWTDGISEVPTVLDHSGGCRVPSSLLTNKGRVRVNLVGSIVDDDILTDRLTTNRCLACIVGKDASFGEDDPQITPSQFDQFVGMVKEDANAAREAVDITTENAAICAEAADICKEIKGSTFYILEGHFIWETEDIEQEVTNGN